MHTITFSYYIRRIYNRSDDCTLLDTRVSDLEDWRRDYFYRVEITNFANSKGTYIAANGNKEFNQSYTRAGYTIVALPRASGSFTCMVVNTYYSGNTIGIHLQNISNSQAQIDPTWGIIVTVLCFKR